jgi:hypothetical protein
MQDSSDLSYNGLVDGNQSHCVESLVALVNIQAYRFKPVVSDFPQAFMKQVFQCKLCDKAKWYKN